MTTREPQFGLGPKVPLKAKRVWMGDSPETCNLCYKPIKTEFVDGATKYGPWALMCLECHSTSGRGLGTGRGQRYEKDSEGQWLKVEG